MVKVEKIALPEPAGSLLATADGKAGATAGGPAGASAPDEAGTGPRVIMVQMLDENEIEDFGREAGLIEAAMPGKPFVLAGMHVPEWHLELTPWPDPHVSRDPRVGTMAGETLRRVTDILIPHLREAYGDLPVILGGYSLGGLFADWAARQTGGFDGVAAVSPSLWIEGWDAYAEANPIHAVCVYLSLGDREEHTKNKSMARVGDRVREENRRLAAALGADGTTLVWNQGGHFVGGPERTAAGFAWCGNRLLP